MGEIINLRQARKAKRRVDAEAQAAANRAKHGRSKAEREVQAREATRAASVVEGGEAGEGPRGYLRGFVFKDPAASAPQSPTL